MSDESTKKAEPAAYTNEQTDKVEELPQDEITEEDAQTVKGGMAATYKKK